MFTAEQLNFPKYDFSFKVLGLHFDAGTMLVKYTPTDIRLSSVDLAILIDATFDMTDLKGYVAKYAPNDKWFAQDMILQHESTLIGAEG